MERLDWDLNSFHKREELREQREKEKLNEALEHIQWECRGIQDGDILYEIIVDAFRKDYLLDLEDNLDKIENQLTTKQFHNFITTYNDN